MSLEWGGTGSISENPAIFLTHITVLPEKWAFKVPLFSYYNLSSYREVFNNVYNSCRTNQDNQIHPTKSLRHAFVFLLYLLMICRFRKM